jgi:putative AlgH/UPF0301 family transcriptional regulator
MQDTMVEKRESPCFLPGCHGRWKDAIRQRTRALEQRSHPLRRAVMFLRKLCCFSLLTTIVAFAVAGRVNRYTKEFAAQSNDAKDLGAGKLLVASRGLADPNFAKTVILLVHCDDQGVVGLILNRRTDVALSRVLEGLQGAKDRSDPAYLGGPVEVSAVFALLQSQAKVEGAENIFTGVYLISTKTLLEHTLAARPDPKVFHVYLGYAGWTKDQLRMEVKLGGWFIFPGDTGAVFDSDPGSLWSKMIGKTELKYAESGPASADPWTRTGPFVDMDRSSGLQQVAGR